MRYLIDIAGTGLAAVLLHPARSATSVLALVVLLLPYLVGLGLAAGLQAEADQSVRFGADLYVAGSQLGLPAPVPLPAVSRIEQIPGVDRVVPRIVGEVVLGKDQVRAVLVGLPAGQFPGGSEAVEGALPRDDPGPHQLVVGTALARQLQLHVGSVLPPFYRNDRGERLSRVVGLFKPDAPLWQASLILTTFDTAAIIFNQSGLATDLLVWCRPEYQAAVSRTIEQGPDLAAGSGRGAVRPRLTARQDLLALVPRGLLHREGIFDLHFLLAFVVGILVLQITSGIGLHERRREIGILKATGWQTDEILLCGFVESLTLSLVGACLAFLLAWVWLRWLNGYGVVGLFVAGLGPAPEVPVPFRLTPVPVLLAFVLSLVIVLTGTVFSSWRAATVAPREAMR
jgi:ABC-type lipoprotein release transport system permease subunit